MGHRTVGRQLRCHSHQGLWTVHRSSYCLNKLYLFSNKAEGTSKAKVDSEVVSVMIHTEESSPNIVVFVSTRENILRYNIVKNSFANPYPINRPNFSPQLSPL